METERHNFLCDLENSLYPTKDWGPSVWAQLPGVDNPDLCVPS